MNGESIALSENSCFLSCGLDTPENLRQDSKKFELCCGNKLAFSCINIVVEHRYRFIQILHCKRSNLLSKSVVDRDNLLDRHSGPYFC